MFEVWPVDDAHAHTRTSNNEDVYYFTMTTLLAGFVLCVCVNVRYFLFTRVGVSAFASESIQQQIDKRMESIHGRAGDICGWEICV